MARIPDMDLLLRYEIWLIAAVIFVAVDVLMWQPFRCWSLIGGDQAARNAIDVKARTHGFVERIESNACAFHLK